MNRRDIRAILRTLGPTALREASTALTDSDEPLTNNMLSTIGNAVSREIQRSLLLFTLEDTGWNMRHTAERLHFSDAAGVRKEIKRLGLTEAYENANRRGPGGQLPRRPERMPK